MCLIREFQTEMYLHTNWNILAILNEDILLDIPQFNADK